MVSPSQPSRSKDRGNCAGGGGEEQEDEGAGRRFWEQISRILVRKPGASPKSSKLAHPFPHPRDTHLRHTTYTTMRLLQFSFE